MRVATAAVAVATPATRVDRIVIPAKALNAGEGRRAWTHRIAIRFATHHNHKSQIGHRTFLRPPRSEMEKTDIALAGETLAAEHLAGKGMRIVARNYRVGQSGEIDIVAMDGDCLVFIEVKTRQTYSFGAPEEAITIRKRRQLARLAQRYLVRENIVDTPCRFDIVAIVLHRGEADIRHIPNAYMLMP
jgi:putative endonuclease